MLRPKYIYISSFELKIVLKRKEKCRVICHCNIIYLFDNHMRLFYVGKKLINFGRTLGRNEIKNLVFIIVVDCKYLIETGVRLKYEHLQNEKKKKKNQGDSIKKYIIDSSGCKLILFERK